MMYFGRFKGTPVVDLMENEPGYFRWAYENVDHFAAKVRAAGLAPDGNGDND